MKTIYVRELKKYTFIEIAKLFKISKDIEEIELLKKLKNYGVIKITKIVNENKNLEELNDEELEVLEENIKDKKKRYAFKYVGIITIAKYVIICYPKYIEKCEKSTIEMKQILKVIKKYNANEQKVKSYSDTSNEKNYNYLSMVIYLINNYYEEGVYSKGQRELEINGEGEVFWEKTINETYAYVLGNRPYYLELYTTIEMSNQENYFTRLHQAILNDCSKKLYEANLCKILDLEIIELSEDSIEELGEKEYILYRLEKEINEQYVTKKQNVLKAMYAYIANARMEDADIGVCFYGTNNFNLVWEKICSEVLKNKINVKLKDLPLNGVDEWKNKTLKEIIEKPMWEIYSDGKERISQKTLTPDLISIFKLNNKEMFAIFDAKYYAMEYNEDKIWNQPGVDDVTKQYLYQLAYEEFINKSGYEFITNAFLLPTEGKTTCMGQAKFGMLANLKNTNLKDIEVIKLNDKKMYDAYVNNKHIEVQEIIKLIKQKKIENNIGLKTIINVLSKVSGNTTDYENNLSDYSYINEEKEGYLKENLIERLAIELDIYFKQKEEVKIGDIKRIIGEKVFNKKSLNLNDRLLEKLKSIYEDIYLVMY